MAKVSDLLHRDVTYDGDINNVPVRIYIYDTPVTYDIGSEEQAHLAMVKEAIEKYEIHAVVYCFEMNNTRIHRSLIRRSVIHNMKSYHSIGLDFSKTVFALTFANCVRAPSSVRRRPGFCKSAFFNERFMDLRRSFIEVLRESVGVQQNALSQIKFCPTKEDPDEELPNGENWFYPLLCAILELLPTTHAMLK